MAEHQFNHIVRVINTDLDGNKPISQALRKIKGISFMMSNAICIKAGLDPVKKAGNLEDNELKKIEDVLVNPTKYQIPSWMLNRRSDPEDGLNKHLLSSDLTFITDNDIKMMKKIKSYKGVRHSLGQPVRGQSTKSHFRKNKGKVQGVTRSKTAKAAASAKEGK